MGKKTYMKYKDEYYEYLDRMDEVGAPNATTFDEYSRRAKLRDRYQIYRDAQLSLGVEPNRIKTFDEWLNS